MGIVSTNSANSHFLKQRQRALDFRPAAQRLQQGRGGYRAVARESVILLSSVVAFEIWYCVAKSQRKESNTARLDAFLAGPLEWTLFDEEDARAAGTIRAALEAIEKPIGAYDVLLAGQARRHRATLVTSNSKEFARVSGLKWEDWAASRR